MPPFLKINDEADETNINIYRCLYKDYLLTNLVPVRESSIILSLYHESTADQRTTTYYKTTKLPNTRNPPPRTYHPFDLHRGNRIVRKEGGGQRGSLFPPPSTSSLQTHSPKFYLISHVPHPRCQSRIASSRRRRSAAKPELDDAIESRCKRRERASE